MCASYESRFSVRQLVDAFAHAGIEVGMDGGGLPNLEPREEVRPTDTDRIVRATPDGPDRARLAPARFGLKASAPKRPPVINLRSEGRGISNAGTSGRALLPVSGFYEFTGDTYPKTRWRLSDAGGAVLMLACVWRAGVGACGEEEADGFALLTGEPGPDIAPYHSRGVIPLPPAAWADWLFDRVPAADLLMPPPAGTLIATAAPRASAARDTTPSPTLFDL
ncbi:SOS response-associated peptidase family protein [uncultured Brevundimonas sp.]|uniref:SOS response-associated peptidase family protein n=1 Tax=uncultured Brevundimonas sp. TaxID=213418 RepID=UPI0025E1A08E|nr:SOS response-associated peptidase family protein [uncultured Brevundimonas sp.]